jgi:hypothetical protein
MTPCSENKQHKRKSHSPPTLFDRLFKRTRTDNDNKTIDSKTKGQDKMTKPAAGTDSKAKANKPSLEKARKKEIKSRLNEEASREIRPLAVGTVAMMASALANQGQL